MTEDNEVEKIKKERDEYLDGWKRAKAELINYKKEEVTRFEEIARYGTEDIVGEMIAVMDNFELALDYLEKDPDLPLRSESRSEGVRIEKGIYLIKNQIEDLLKRRGLHKIDAKPGDKFDPSRHEAISVVASDRPEGTIVEVIETGYTLHGRILRPARVKTSKGHLKN